MRYINADLASAKFTGNFIKFYSARLIRMLIDTVPTADVQTIHHAAWIEDGYESGHIVCSYCGSGKPKRHGLGKISDREIRYCYYCGAKMDGNADE